MRVPPTAGDDHALGYDALVVMQVVGLWGALHFHVAGRQLGGGATR